MADLGHQMTDTLLSNMESRVSAVYEQAYQESKTKLDKYLEKFQEQDMEQKKKVISGEITQEEYTTWRKRKIATGSRYRNMTDKLSDDLVRADQIATKIVNGDMASVYALNYNYASYQLEHDTQMNLNYTLYDENTVENLLKDPEAELLPKSKVDIPKDKRWNRTHINNAITQGILQGESITDISKRLQSVTDMGKSAAIRNARTMTTGAENAGRVTSYKQAQSMGIELQQEWLATLDGRTRHSHRVLDGERVEVGKKFSNGCRYPGDPQGRGEEVYNCRCRMVAAIKGIDQSDAPRISDLGDMSYEEWKGLKQNTESAKSVQMKLKNGEHVSTQEYISAGKEVISNSGREKIEKELQEERRKFQEIEDSIKDLSMKTDEGFAARMDGYHKKSLIRNRINELLKERKNVIKNAISSARGESFGFSSDITEQAKKIHFLGTRRGKARKAIESGYESYPTSWVDASMNYSNIKCLHVDRGYSADRGRTIAISGFDEMDDIDTAIHELGHRYEDIFPELLSAEKDFYQYRTAGESLQWLGGSYSKDEVARFDNFVDPYMGKDYGGDAYELFSMGSQSLFSEVCSFDLSNDPEYEEFIVGLLSTIGM